jgi:hypothetical protein
MNRQTTSKMNKGKEAAVASGVLQRQCACGTYTSGGNCSSCSKNNTASQIQRKATNDGSGSETPPIVHDVLRSQGQALNETTRAFFEPRFGHDFSNVRVHTDEKAAQSAQAVNALAYTVGRDLVFGAGQYDPAISTGQRLLAHELAHSLQQNQQSGASSSTLAISQPQEKAETEASETAESIMDIQTPDVPGKGTKSAAIPIQHRPMKLLRVPAAPTNKTGNVAFDRSKVVIGDIPDFKISTATNPPTVPKQKVNIAFNHPDVVHLTWEMYDPADKYLSGFSTIVSSPTATTEPYEISDMQFSSTSPQGRYLLRCEGLNAANESIVYAEKTFFVWTSTPISQMDLKSLTNIKTKPASHSLGEVGAAQARSMMLEHQAAVAATGTGTVQGNQCSAPAAGVAKSDCTNYVLDILKFAFNAKGKSADWEKVFKEAQKTSGGSFKGNELVKALIGLAGWKAVFWGPDPRNPEDKTAEHPVAYKRVRESGEYRSSNEKTGIPVDATKSVINYRRTSATKQEDMTGIDKLHKIPLAVITARGGTHMTLLLNGQVYEVHWDKPATDPNVIEATPLEKWQWQSGAVVMPAEDYAKAF